MLNIWLDVIKNEIKNVSEKNSLLRRTGEKKLAGNFIIIITHVRCQNETNE